jgi:NADPH:quinone reductase-like Zn-dependent oxidoreductase
VILPPTMCAATLTGFGGLEMLELRDDVPVPEPGAHEVVVEVIAASLNNTDIWTREGAYGLPGRPDALAGWRGPIAFPRVQGGDIAGRIVAVGAGVEAARVGERVVVDPAIYDRDAPDANPVGLLVARPTAGSRSTCAWRLSAHTTSRARR